MKRSLSDISTYESGVLQSAAHRFTMKIKTDFLADYGLTVMQWFAIGYTYDAGEEGLRIQELQRQFDASMPFITNLVNTLILKGILIKTTSSSDARIKIIKLDRQYRKKVAKIEEGLREKLRAELYGSAQISRDELEAYITVLEKIVSVKRMQ